MVDFVDTALNLTSPAAGFAARPPGHVKTLAPDETPPAGAWSVIAVAVVSAVMVPTPGAVHDTVVDATNRLTLASSAAFRAVNVMVSPLTSAVVTPMEKTIDVGVCPATTSFTEALVHVSAVATMSTAAEVATAAAEESSTVNVYAPAAGFAARPPVHVIVFCAALIPPAPTVSVKVPWFPLIALPPAPIAVASLVTAQRGAAPPTFHSA